MTQRPWPVYLLVVFSLASLVFGQAIDSDRNLWDAASILFSVFLAWGLWTGRQWAFSMSFMLASLCVVLALGVAFVQVFLMELDLSIGLMWAAVASALWITLLTRPSTKRFAGFEPRNEATLET